MTRWIVFDAMGVIFEEGDDIINGLVPFLRRRGPKPLDAEAVHAVYRRASLGEISPQAFWEAIGFGKEYPAIEKEYLDTCLQLDPSFVETAEQLSRDFALAVLSNDIAEWSARLRRKHNLDRLFQAVVVSDEVGVRKPAPEIYRILLGRLQADGKDCVFIDDRIQNLTAAAALGIHPVWMGKDAAPANPEIPNRIRTLSELPRVIGEIFQSP
ncbi:MAG: HAD-IA family hydrolase [Anaerolineales bacterium]|nr:HAD-IA family hydrolase [Anaerolineales bacterium]